MSTISYEVLRERLLTVIREMHAEVINAPDEDWPGMLFIGDEDGLAIDYVVGLSGMSDAEKQHLGRVLLPARIRAASGRMFAWVAPGLMYDDPDRECLLLVVGDRRWRQAYFAPLTRTASGPPLLDAWRGPMPASGLFVDPLAAAVA